jgi:hypothetical protein
MLTIDQYIQRYQQGMSSPTAQQRYKDGVLAVTQAPTAKAATPEALQRYQDGVMQSVTSGRRAQALNAVNLGDWQAAATTKGAPRLASGAMGAANKQRASMPRWLGVYDNVSKTVAAMPKGGLANAQARSAKAIEMMMQAANKI